MKKRTITEAEAAKQVGIGLSTLRKLRLADKVPSWRQIGRIIRYTPEDVERLLASIQRGKITKCDQLSERRLTEVRFG